MSRRRKPVEREILPDPKYDSLILSKFINSVMTRGKKSIAEKIVYGALDILHEKTSKEAIEVFTEAISNIKPLVKVLSKKSRWVFLSNPGRS